MHVIKQNSNWPLLILTLYEGGLTFGENVKENNTPYFTVRKELLFRKRCYRFGRVSRVASYNKMPCACEWTVGRHSEPLALGGRRQVPIYNIYHTHDLTEEKEWKYSKWTDVEYFQDIGEGKKNTFSDKKKKSCSRLYSRIMTTHY